MLPTRPASVSLLLGSLSLLLPGCGKPAASAAKAPAAAECPEGQTFDGQFCQVTGAPPPEAPPKANDAPASAEAQPSPAGETPPAAVPTETAGRTPEAPPPPGKAYSLATPVDVSMAAQAGPLITYLAGSHLPAGARPFGAPFAAQFAEGQVFEQQVKLTLGKCYTVVAAGLPPVSELAMELNSAAITTAPSVSAQALLADEAVGPQAVLGSRAACFKADRTDVWLLLRVDKGQGVVAGQVFEK